MTRRKFRRAKECLRRLPRIEQLQIRSKGHSEGVFVGGLTNGQRIPEHF